MRGFLKFIANVLMVIFIIFFPLSLFLSGVGQTLYHPDDFFDMVEEEILDPDVLANIAEELLKENKEFQEAKGDNLFANVILMGAFNLDHEEWVSIINYIAPPEIVSGAFDQALDSYYRWIDGRSPVPLIQVSLSPWKNSIQMNTLPLLELILRDIRACNPDEIQRYNIARLSGDYNDIPSCRPPEPNYSWILETGAVEAPEFLGTSLPSQIDNSEALSESTKDPIEVKQNYLGTVAVMRAGWILLIILFIVAIPLSVTSLRDFFPRIGWPLLIAGVWGLLLSILLMILTSSVMALVGNLSSGSIPAGVFSQIEAMGSSLVQFFQRPLLVNSIIIFVVGGISLIIGVVIGRKKSEKAASDPQPVKTVQQKQEDEGDDSSPTGMFG